MHARTRAWLDSRLDGSAQVGLPWPSLLGFLRLVTNRHVCERPASATNAWRQVNPWLECDVAWIPQPTDQHREVLGQLLEKVNVAANLVPDAHISALAIEHGLTLARRTAISPVSLICAGTIRCCNSGCCASAERPIYAAGLQH